MVPKLSSVDPVIAQLIRAEARRQKECLALIPSENYASLAVRQAVGSVLMNKYAEGQPHKRYYQGNGIIDRLEDLAKSRALKAFDLDPDHWGVNVQTLSGSPANLAVYNALLAPGDRIMAMYLPDGGHLSHGWQLPGKKITLVSKIWDIHFYHVDQKTRMFDYDAIRRQAFSVKPKLLVSGGTAYAREIEHEAMGKIAREIGAYYMADIAHEAGLVAAGVNQSPFAHAHIVSMTTHKTLRGPRGAIVFSRRRYEGDTRISNPVDLSALVNSSVFPGIQGGPHEHTVAGIAVALHETMQPEFKTYARQVVSNAKVLASEFFRAGIDVVGGGTDKHLVLLDLRTVGVSAWVAAWALEYAGIIVNRNTVPFDTGSSFYPSGLRLGTPAVTTRGMKEPEMKTIADWIIRIFGSVKEFRLPDDPGKRVQFASTLGRQLHKLPVVREIRRQVKSLTGKFPLP